MNKSWLFWNVAQGRLVVADVSGQPIASIFKVQAVQVFLDCLTVEDGTDSLTRNVGNYNYQSTLRDIPQEQIPQGNNRTN